MYFELWVKEWIIKSPLQFLSYEHKDSFKKTGLNRYITKSQNNDQLPVGLRAQLVEHCTSVTEVMNLNPVQP